MSVEINDTNNLWGYLDEYTRNKVRSLKCWLEAIPFKLQALQIHVKLLSEAFVSNDECVADVLSVWNQVRLRLPEYTQKQDDCYQWIVYVDAEGDRHSVSIRTILHISTMEVHALLHLAEELNKACMAFVTAACRNRNIIAPGAQLTDDAIRELQFTIKQCPDPAPINNISDTSSERTSQASNEGLVHNSDASYLAAIQTGLDSLISAAYDYQDSREEHRISDSKQLRQVLSQAGESLRKLCNPRLLQLAQNAELSNAGRLGASFQEDIGIVMSVWQYVADPNGSQWNVALESLKSRSPQLQSLIHYYGSIGYIPKTQSIKGERSKPDATTEAILPVLLSASDIAKRIQKNRQSVTSFLSRFAEKHPDCRVETESKRKNEPGYLYRMADVWPALEKWMKDNSEN